MFFKKFCANMILSNDFGNPPILVNKSSRERPLWGSFSLYKMRSVDSRFYKTAQWKRCRVEYLRLHPWCEECMKHGRYNPARYVHHKVFLNETNVDNPEVSLNFANLEALCMDCHNKIHFGGNKKRYAVDEFGRISPLSEY